MNNTRLIFLILATLSFYACGDPPASQYPVSAPVVTATDLGTGDEIQIRIEYGPQSDEIIMREYVLDESGEIALPYIDIVEANGKTLAELRNEIKTKLADGYLKNPIVWINLKNSSSVQFSILGEVKTPNLYPFKSGMSILDAISAAGGFTGMARKNAVTVIRRNNGEDSKRFTVPVGRIQENKANDFQILPGDVITVPQRLL